MGDSGRKPTLPGIPVNPAQKPLPRAPLTRTGMLQSFQKVSSAAAAGNGDTAAFRKLADVVRRVGKIRGKIFGAAQSNARIRETERRLRKAALPDVKTVVKRPAVPVKKAEPVKKRAVKNKLYRSRVRNAQVAAARPGDEGKVPARSTVKSVQHHLRAVRLDGVLDDRTDAAVKNFQKREGLVTTGRVDARTWARLRARRLEAGSGHSARQPFGERAGAVRSTEGLLRKAGISAGQIDGVYSGSTQRAQHAARQKSRLQGRGTAALTAIRRAVKNRMSTNTVTGCARQLLASKNVSFWTGLSTGSERTALERAARGGEHAPFRLALMQALVAMARKGPILIIALTGGAHAPNSHHRRGTAVDLDLSVGTPRELEEIARRYGGIRNWERDHMHLDF